jgi:hypothetical protein
MTIALIFLIWALVGLGLIMALPRDLNIHAMNWAQVIFLVVLFGPIFWGGCIGAGIWSLLGKL